LATLVPGALLAAGSANHGVDTVPIGMLVLQGAMVIMGSLVALTAARGSSPGNGSRRQDSRWNRSAYPVMPCDFLQASLLANQCPAGYGRGRFKGFVEVELPICDWEMVEDQIIETPQLRW
jgi:hypothetical protein